MALRVQFRSSKVAHRGGVVRRVIATLTYEGGVPNTIMFMRPRCKLARVIILEGESMEILQIWAVGLDLRLGQGEGGHAAYVAYLRSLQITSR